MPHPPTNPCPSPVHPGPAFRRPIPPAPIECYDVSHPAVPPALDGLRILHISDTHVRRKAAGHREFRRLIHALRSTPADLIALTGDFMTRPGDEEAALWTLRATVDAWRDRPPRLGALALFGNHDSAAFRAGARRLDGLTWVENRCLDVPGLPLRIIGTSYPEDLFATMLDDQARDTGVPPVTYRAFPTPAAPEPTSPFLLGLAHHPSEVFPAAEFGVHLLLAGHTHGGQWRLSPRLAPHTSSDLPMHLACGILRLRGTLCCISRGLGESAVELRVNCPAQLPLYTLRRGPMPGPTTGRDYLTLTQVVGW